MMNILPIAVACCSKMRMANSSPRSPKSRTSLAATLTIPDAPRATRPASMTPPRRCARWRGRSRLGGHARWPAVLPPVARLRGIDAQLPWWRVELEHPEGRTEDGLRDVAHLHAARRHAPLAAPVGVPVDHELGARAVDRLGQQVASEERVDLERLP